MSGTGRKKSQLVYNIICSEISVFCEMCLIISIYINNIYFSLALCLITMAENFNVHTRNRRQFLLLVFFICSSYIEPSRKVAISLLARQQQWPGKKESRRKITIGTPREGWFIFHVTPQRTYKTHARTPTPTRTIIDSGPPTTGRQPS